VSNTPKISIFPVWPVYIALGVVALLIAGMIALDARLEQRVSTETADMLDSTRRAIVWLDRIRSRGEDLHREGVTEADRARLSTDITELIGKIESLGAYSDRAEWPVIKGLLQRLLEVPLDDHETRRTLA
jgi:hypothetical protein